MLQKLIFVLDYTTVPGLWVLDCFIDRVNCIISRIVDMPDGIV